MILRRLVRAAMPLLVIGALSILPGARAVASDEGQAAADQVSEASYRYFLGDNQGVEGILYTHAGDNRGNGAEHDLGRDAMAAHLESYGLSVELEPFNYGGTYYNVVATKLGTVYPDQEFIVGAHFDSANNPGADDNASGCALVLEVARILSQYDSDYTIRFIGFDREEQGLIGSDAYVSAHINDNILGMISTDMVAYNTGADSADIYGRAASNPIKNALAAAVIEYGEGLSYSIQGSYDASDHAPFEWAGFDACLFIEDWGNPYYHTQSDNVDMNGYIDYGYAVRMARAVVGYLVDHAGVQVDISTLKFEYPDGQPELVAPHGGTRMRVTVAGLGDKIPQPGTGLLYYDVGNGWESTPMEEQMDNVYDAVFPAAECGLDVFYYVSAEATDGEVFTDPRQAPDTAYSALAAYGVIAHIEDDFETDQGWSVVNENVDTGAWVRGVPAQGGDRGDPPADFDGSSRCYVTGNTNDEDLDGGPTRLISPQLDLSGGADYVLSYARWFYNDDNDIDRLEVEISNDDGGSWVTVESVTHSGRWVLVEFAVADFVTPTAQVRVRFSATDNPNDSVTEAGVDAFGVFVIDCDRPCIGDLDGDGITGQSDLGILLAAWGIDDGGDLDGDGQTGQSDLGILLADWGCGA